jgi:hypothetical protein
LLRTIETSTPDFGILRASSARVFAPADRAGIIENLTIKKNLGPKENLAIKRSR